MLFSSRYNVEKAENVEISTAVAGSNDQPDSAVSPFCS